MKATIDIPDDLYRKVKAKTAEHGRRIRDVTIELFQVWLTGGDIPQNPAEQKRLRAALRKGIGKSHIPGDFGVRRSAALWSKDAEHPPDMEAAWRRGRQL